MPRTATEEAEFQMLQKKFGNTSAPANQQITNYDSNNPQNFAEWLANTPAIQATLGAGDALSNMLEGIRTTATGGEFNPIQSGEGMAYDVGQFGGEIAPYFLPGGAAGRIALGTGLGYTSSPEDRIGGALTGGAFGALGESLPHVAKGLGSLAKKGANKITRHEDMKILADKLQSFYKESKAKGSEIINKLTSEFGDNPLAAEQVAEIAGIYEQALPTLPIKAKAAFKEFMDNPNLTNAQRLQSLTGEAAAKIDDFKISSDLSEARNAVIGGMESAFERAAPYAKEFYGDFRKIFREDVFPLEKNRMINRVVHGGREGVTPQNLSRNLNLVTEGELSTAPVGGMLQQSAKDFGEKMARSNLYSAGLGGTVGSLVAGPIGGALGAGIGAGGGFASRMLQPNYGELISNPQLAAALQKAGGLYPFVRPAIQAYPNSFSKE